MFPLVCSPAVPDELQLLATATLEIAAPPGVVREQFFDLDQHVREHIYHGHELSWAPQHPPEARRLRMLTRILGRTQDEEFVIEDGDDATWVRRYVEGPNVGARMVARFQPLDAGTRVRLESWVPARGFVSGLGKLSKIGMEKMLEKTLGEHQRAIEGYKPKQPRGALGVVMASLRELRERLGALGEDERMATIQTFLELGCLVAIADGHADDAERGALHRVLHELCNVELSDEAMAQMIDSAHEVVASDGIETRCDYVGAALKAFGLSELGLELAALIGLVSHGLDQHELAALGRIAAAAGVDEARMSELVATVDRELSGELA